MRPASALISVAVAVLAVAGFCAAEAGRLLPTAGRDARARPAEAAGWQADQMG